MLLYFLVFLQFILLLIAIGIVIYIGLVMASFKNPVPYVPTPRKIINKMIEVANIQPGEKIVDLGSGTGRIVLAVANNYPVEVIGVEKSRLLCFISKARLVFSHKKGQARIIHKDFQNYSLLAVKVVFCFLTPKGLKMLQDKFRKELPKSARLVSYLFPLANKMGFKESKTVVKEGKKGSYIFVYNKV